MYKFSLTLLFFVVYLHQVSSQPISIAGTIWLDSNANTLDDAEIGISDVKVYLRASSIRCLC